MKTKQEVIQEAWTDAVGLERYEYLKEELIFDGFLHFQPTSLKSVDAKIIDGCPFYRPKSLAGIEDNNGWKRIESEADLPTTEMDCWVMQGGRMYIATLWNTKFWHREVYKNVFPITHYQPIVKPEKPLY